MDAQVAHLYGLTEPEFTHILSPFPLVPAPVKAVKAVALAAAGLAADRAGAK